MSRYGDRRESSRLYVGHLSSRTRSRDLENLFGRYGRIRDVDMKRDFAFVDFSDFRDADDARHDLNGREFVGSRIVVEFAKGAPRGPGGFRDREFLGNGPPPGSGCCFNCGLDGHWARDCKEGDWKNKCYRCGESGHIERRCNNSPQKFRRGRSRSYSRSPSPRRGRNRSPNYKSSRSYSPSRSPRRRQHSVERLEKISKSPRNSRRSPKRREASPLPSNGRNRSPGYIRSSSYSQSRSPPRRQQSVERLERISKSSRDSRSPKQHRVSSPYNGRNRSPNYRRSCSYSRSRSPLRKWEESVEHLERKSRSPSVQRSHYSKSPIKKLRNPSDEGSPRNGPYYSRSPVKKSISPISDEDIPGNASNRSPFGQNGHNRSPSPTSKNDAIPINESA